MEERLPKRRRKADDSLVRLLPEAFPAVPIKECPENLLSHRTRLGSDGILWCSSQEAGSDTIQLSAIDLDGEPRIVRRGLTSIQELIVSSTPGEILLIDARSGNIKRARLDGEILTMADTNARSAAMYKGTLLVHRRDQENKTFERRSASGILQNTVHMSAPFTGHFIALNEQVIVYISGNSLYKLDLQTQTKELIAGSVTEAGCADGCYSDARFNRLKQPFYNHDKQCILVRDVQAGGGIRHCRIDRATKNVTTFEVQGLTSSVKHFWWGLSRTLLYMDNQLHWVDWSTNLLESTFIQDMSTLDWSQSGMVSFQLPEVPPMFADRRVLCARSEYFSALLSPEHGMKEAIAGVVDLRQIDIVPAAFRAVLSYLSTDDFGMSTSDGGLDQDLQAVMQRALLCIEIAKLANQYHLVRLQRLAECFVLKVALPNRDAIVLPLLRKSWKVNTAIEDACWEALGQRAATILQGLDSLELRHFLDEVPSELRMDLVLRIARDS